MKKIAVIILILLPCFSIMARLDRSFVRRNHVHKIHNDTDGRIRIRVNTNGNQWGWYPQVEELEPGEKKDINVYAWCTNGFVVEGLGGSVEDKKAEYTFKNSQCASYQVTIVYERTRLNATKIVQIRLKKLAEHT